jgi:hypothetical protein
MDETHDLRIPNPGVLQDDLVETTRVAEVDAFLFSLVNILVIAMRERLRCVLLIGSYAHGGAAPDSDVDLCIVWKNDSTPDDWHRGGSLWQHFARGRGYVLDPMWELPETPLYDPEAVSYAFSFDGRGVEAPCGPLLKQAMRNDSILLWGEDIRPRVRMPESPQLLLQDALAAPVNWIRRSHGTRITPPSHRSSAGCRRPGLRGREGRGHLRYAHRQGARFPRNR